MIFSAFKAYDIRGNYPKEVNEELAYAVGRALVRKLSAKTVVVGRDMRESSPSLSAELIKGISCEGADVVDIGLCTTPMLNFAVAHYGYDGGVMVSASHNPASDNAFKLIGPGADMIDIESGLLDIQEIIKKGFAGCHGNSAVTKKEILGDYLAHLLKKIKDIEHRKVVVDYSSGVGSISGKPAFARFDLELTELNEEPNGTFPAHPANPHDINNFNQLINEVRSKKADLGIFYDGDADRAIFVDDIGRVVPMDLLTVLLAKPLLEKNPKEKIYYDLRFSKSVKEEIEKLGGVPVMMKVGNPVYKRALKKEGGVLAVEFSGHVMYAENHNIDDGLFVSLKVMELLSESQEKLSVLLDSVKTHQSSEEISLEAKNPQTVYERIYQAFPGNKIELDGAYVDLPDGFVSVRQSQNEPQLFRVRVEARTIDEMNTRLNKVIEIVKS